MDLSFARTHAAAAIPLESVFGIAVPENPRLTGIDPNAGRTTRIAARLRAGVVDALAEGMLAAIDRGHDWAGARGTTSGSFHPAIALSLRKTS